MTRVLIPLGLFCLALVGCGSGARLLDTPPPPATGASISGKLLSGSIPVSGAHVYLMAVAETGFGKPSISLLNAGSTGSQDSTGTYVLTASDGTFTLPGQYSCSATTNVYVFTSGGDSGLGQNSAATHLATVGACPQQGAVVTPLTINEVTTVAMAFATASFATDPLHVSSSGSPLARTGEANAFTNASHLASVNTGIAPAMLPSGAATVPQTTINTLANILFSCNHSAGPGSAACQSLLGSAGSAGPYSDTAAAMLGIAHSPANSVATLFAQQSTAPPFAPYLTVAPNDFSLGLVFTGGGMNATQGMAVDSMGNVWGTNDSYNLTEISSAGVFLSGPNGYVTGAYFPGQIAVDLNDNVWIGSGAHTFDGPGSLVEVSSSGMTLSGVDGYGHGLIHTPLSLAIDGNNNIWIADMAGNSVAEFSNSGQILSGTIGFTGGGVSNPYTIAIDASSNAWVTNYSSHGLTELTSTGSPLSPATGFTGAGFPGGGGIALDHSGEVWIASAGTFSPQVSKLSATGAILSGAGYVGGGIKAGEGSTSIAIDGDGNAWLPLYVGPGVVELSNAGIPLSGNNGLQGGVAQFPNSIVLDGSGDVWVANDTLAISPVRGVPSVYTWRITELIGAAAPVVTPLAAAVKGNALGSRP